MHVVQPGTRIRITISGVIQGVGFRPFVYNLATRHNLIGYVCNKDGVVEIEIQGTPVSVQSFVEQLETETPPLAAIEQITKVSIPAQLAPESTFEIRKSIAGSRQQKFIPPDSATCSDCLGELFDNSNRRFRYPFINCTNCGPRFTIISSLPYDRAATTMMAFKMCPVCQSEYDDPANRRFHAQPNACAECGPSISFIDPSNRLDSYHHEDALARALEEIEKGRIVAIKGLGGFHLVCDATNSGAIRLLRQRKSRAKKPFAVMMTNLDMVNEYCLCSQREAHELQTATRPIVLLPRRSGCTLPEQIAPNIERLGIMLPYTPLHHLLTADYKKPLLATSANISEEPIAIDNNEAISRLVKIADSFLVHDRKIYSRYDDSVVQIVPAGRTTLRRARGLAPLPIKLPFQSSIDVLACGAHLKNTFCFIHKDQAFVSQHIGDLENIETYEHFQQSLSIYERLFDFSPDIFAHDCHPDYLSTALAHEIAKRKNLPTVAVQHHHAHIVSCMIEHALTELVIGVAFDGLGYGADGTLWGGEVLLTSLNDYQRLAWFDPVPMPGANRAVKEPWRMALGYITSSKQNSIFATFMSTLTNQYGERAVNTVKKQIDKKLNSPLTSSCGRLFDALSALLGVCFEASYEGQAAMELETLANQIAATHEQSFDAYVFQIIDDNMSVKIDSRSILEAAYIDHLKGTPTNIVAYKFHKTIAEVILNVSMRVRRVHGVSTVCLSGGVFQNALLLGLAHEALVSSDFNVFFPQKLPANDGGLSLGQAVIALANAGAISALRL